MLWFGFGFNAFGQISACGDTTGEFSDAPREVKVTSPAELAASCSSRRRVTASWSRTGSLRLDGGGGLALAGFSAGSCASAIRTRGCTDASISESHVTLMFPDRIESWDLQKVETSPWILERRADGSGLALNLPLVPGGYIATKPPLYRPLPPHLKARSLALSAGHAVLLTDSGAVFTWGTGSHGQLGHGGLTSEEEPRAVEALWGMPMSCVATGGWHSICVSDGGDLYVWGWNQHGQLGLPSRGLRKAPPQQCRQQAALSRDSSTDGSTRPADQPLEREEDEVFISIQAFPALLDITPSCEVRTVSCGSRHTAAVTTTGDLYTWGWGEYGQLGHQTLISADEPRRVEFFRQQQMRVVDVVCGAWNTFAAVIKEEVTKAP